MNEGVISSYEHLIGGSGLPSDLAIEMAAATSIHATIGTDYHKEIIPQESQNQHSRSFHHPSTYNNLIGAVCDGTTQNIVPAQMSFTCNNNNSATYIGNGTSNTAFTQIPFVQIHTTDVQPQSAFNSTRFRRNLTNNNQEEIKAEPIKSENSESAKERINGTPTPPVPVQQRNESQTSKNFTQNEKVVYSDLETTREPSDEVNEKNTKTCTKRGTSFTFPNIYKCQHCAFISLTERSLQLHLNSSFQGTSRICENAISRTKLPCPGCDNIFYAYSVVETHLREDHLMSEEDITELMQTIKRNNQPSEQSNTVSNVKTSDIEVSNDASIKGTQRRSRIYLKNVECLREPNRDPIEQQDNLINDSLFHFENDECNALENIGSISMEEQDLIGMLTNGEPLFHNKSDNNIDNIVNETIAATVETNKSVNPPKQKISIKSVDVLREPALARRGYELQPFGDFISVCNDLNLHVPNNSNNNDNNESNCDNSHSRINNTDAQYSYSVPPNREPLVGNNGDAGIAEFTNEFEKPRRPKIYIKNVDILKEPMTFSNNVNTASITESTNNVMNFNFMQPTIPQTVNSYLDTVDNLNATVPPFNGGMSQLPLGTISEQYLFDSGSGNFLVNSTTTVSDNYTYGNEQTTENFLMDSNRFADAITPMTTEPTPSPPTMSTTVSHNNNCTTDAQLTQNANAIANVQKQKIFIKNVDILKEPQFQEPRGLLHLRTVDELNLMNRKDVENLIAPNLEGNQANLVEEELNDNFARSNNANGESLSAIDNCNTSNLIEAISYGCEGFKLNEFSTQNGWHDDYDLGDDIREIITSTMAPTLSSAQKTIHDLDTPQISLISIPDMEELTGTSAELNVSSESVTSGDPTMTSTVTQQQISTNFTFECEIPSAENISLEEPVCSSENLVNTSAICNEVMSEPQTEPESIDTARLESVEVLKQERLNQATPGEHTDQAPTQKNKANNFDDIPPLTPMTSATYAVSTNLNTSTTIVTPTGLPVPPLVPMLPPKAIALTNVNTPANSTERGRIYVANNLMQAPNTATMAQTPKAQTPTTKSHSTKSLDKQQTKTPIAVSVTGGTSVRGRPFGSNRTGVTKLRKQPLNENGAGVYLKCSVTGCAFRFKKSSTLDYHIKCHSSESPPQSMACPECKAPFTNWNSLHTHLWRTHKIDMELYSCELCSFKTPIYSRLLNTHSKIHYDERNYKCDQCEKAFKNTKQLKNHRRWHRNHNKSTTPPSAKREVSKKADVSASESGSPALLPPTTTSASTSDATQVPVTAARNFYRCKDCDAVFSHQKTLREHLCKNAAAAVQCEVCDRVLTSRSSIKLHMQTHESSRRFKCNVCDYSGSDHNAFRRHKMTHDNNAKMYACAHCDYKSIQSVAYQKHVQLKHPQVADSIVYKCKMCTYATINKGLFDLHQLKHEKKNDNIEATAALPGENAVCAEKTTTVKTKIKVKSHLLLTTSTDSTMESNELCFDAVTMPS